MKGICIDDSNSINLKKGKTYYLFPHGDHAYYVSRFPNPNSHFGAFSKNRFEIESIQVDSGINNKQEQLSLF